MLGLRSIAACRTAVSMQRRNAGGYMRKNIRVEENAGLRESSYKTWNFNYKNVFSLSVGMFIPCFIAYNFAVEEMMKKHQQVGSGRKHGTFFSIAHRD